MSGSLAEESFLLSPVPSVLQALIVLALVGLLVAREVLDLRDPAAPVAGEVARLARLLLPIGLGLLVVRLLVILQ